MKKLTDVAISPDEDFHADMAVLHILNEHDLTAPIKLGLELWSFKFEGRVDMKKSVMSTALDRAYVENYATSKSVKTREDESVHAYKHESEDKNEDKSTSETITTQFQNLVLGNKLISNLLRVHVHATAHHTNFDFRDEPNADVNHPENETLIFVSLNDLESLIDADAMNLIKMIALRGNKSRFSDPSDSNEKVVPS
jgi:hypothetical protein